MSHEAKREAIDIARSNSVNAYDLPDISVVDIRDKPLRYGLLHSPISWAVERLNTSDEVQHSIAQFARNLTHVRISVMNNLNACLYEAESQIELRPVINLIDAIQDQKARSKDPDVRSIHRTAFAVMSAGATTYSQVSENVYNAIEERFGSDIASHPMHASIVNKAAQLGLKQLSAFTFSYLSQSDEFSQLLEERKNGGVKLSTDWQLRAPVLAKFNENWQLISEEDLDGEKIQLCDIDEDVIGCPVAFNYKDVAKLWNFYAQTRHLYTQKQILAGKSIKLTSEQEWASSIIDRLAAARTSD